MRPTLLALQHGEKKSNQTHQEIRWHKTMHEIRGIQPPGDVSYVHEGSGFKA